jgi:hypothetical protein
MRGFDGADGRRASRRELVIVYVMALVAFGYFAGTWEDANTYSRLGLVRALAVEHRFEIDTTQTDEAFRAMRTGDRSFYNGHYYSDKAIGSSLIGAAAWAPVHWLLATAHLPSEGRAFTVTATFLGVSIICALIAPLMYAFVVRISGAEAATLVTCAIVFGTGVFKYSTGYYGHVQAGLFYLGAFAIWYAARRRQRISYTEAFASCVLLGYMVVTEYPTAVLALVLGIYMLVVLRETKRLSDWRVWMVSAAGFALALTPLLHYNVRVYGAPLTTGYQHHATAQYAAAHARGLSGIGLPDPIVMIAMTFHPLMGIFWQSPVLLLAFVGWVVMGREERRAELWLSLGAIVTYIAVISGYYEWEGGLAYTPRHIIPILPLFAIPLAFVPRRWRALAWCLAAISIAQHAIAAAARMDYLVKFVAPLLDASHHPTTIFASTIWDICWLNLRRGLFLKNRGALFLSRGFLSLLPLLAIEAALAIALHRAAVTGSARGRIVEP